MVEGVGVVNNQITNPFKKSINEFPLPSIHNMEITEKITGFKQVGYIFCAV